MRPNLSVSQNFLKSTSLVAKLIKDTKLKQGETVLDIGAGKGIITTALAKVVGETGRVVALELDNMLFTSLEKHFADQPQVEMRKEDVLQFNFAQLGDYKVFANIPFSITSSLLEKLFTPATGPLLAHLILQEDALIGFNKFGEETETFKSLLIAPLYDISVAYSFGRGDFIPRPSVDTALFSFARRDDPLIRSNHFALYKDFLAFASRDRVGEGAWLKMLSKKQIKRLANESELVFGRGLKSQSVAGIVAAFELFVRAGKQQRVAGAMAQLREAQAKREAVALAGGHRREKDE